VQIDVPKTMRAAVYRGINNIQLETVPVPQIGPKEVLVKVAVCGVCPTDIKKIQYGTVPPPRIFGHETAGTIVRVGKKVPALWVGQRVALHHHIPCLNCHACEHKAFAQCAGYKRTGITAGFEPAGGGFAQYVRVMDFCLAGVEPIPQANSFLEGAMLEPVNTVLKAVRMLNLLKHDKVLVAGQGPIGLMFTRLLKLEGAKVLVTDLFEERLRFGRKFGAKHAVNPVREDVKAAVEGITKARGLDAAVIAVPSDDVVREAQGLLRGGGIVLLFAHTKRGTTTALDLSTICVDEKQLVGSYSADFTLQKEVARLVFSRRLDVRKLITHEFPLARTSEAIAMASKPSAEALKIVVRPDL
jgi:L-iditol 2-dehydrogenase